VGPPRELGVGEVIQQVGAFMKKDPLRDPGVLEVMKEVQGVVYEAEVPSRAPRLGEVQVFPAVLEDPHRGFVLPGFIGYIHLEGSLIG